MADLDTLQEQFIRKGLKETGPEAEKTYEKLSTSPKFAAEQASHFIPLDPVAVYNAYKEEGIEGAAKEAAKNAIMQVITGLAVKGLGAAVGSIRGAKALASEAKASGRSIAEQKAIRQAVAEKMAAPEAQVSNAPSFKSNPKTMAKVQEGYGAEPIPDEVPASDTSRAYYETSTSAERIQKGKELAGRNKRLDEVVNRAVDRSKKQNLLEGLYEEDRNIQRWLKDAIDEDEAGYYNNLLKENRTRIDQLETELGHKEAAKQFEEPAIDWATEDKADMAMGRLAYKKGIEKSLSDVNNELLGIDHFIKQNEGKVIPGRNAIAETWDRRNELIQKRRALEMNLYDLEKKGPIGEAVVATPVAAEGLNKLKSLLEKRKEEKKK